MSKNMKIAVPVNEGRLHGHFGGAREFAIIEADPVRKVVINSRIIEAPPHQPGLFPRWLRGQGVQTVIAGGIGHRALTLFTDAGIEVKAGLPDTPVEALIGSYLNGEITQSPNGCEHHGDHSHGSEHP